ncbi:hypothetical protein BMI91_05680 [Thioclava sediminum]|uniref:Glycosyltransferase n=1 Tax=Thioclava sediminum TaxID=1915319 RepID=A0ABX3N280_9RHOB|nr:hypothetical protein [Thioclava sediminum]OOY25878.1 hypothetical protein BMI91_05680 [Thioclava sediminum]
MSAAGIIYSRTDKGHKISYGLTLRALYGFEVRHGERSAALLRDLVAAPNLIFSTLDDDYITFFRVALARWLRRRPTSALFLRPQTCLAPRSAVQRLKCALFRAIRGLGIANVLTIVSFEAEPAYAGMAADWVDDPEFFDLDMKLTEGTLPTTPLSDTAQARAAGRSIVAMPGALTARKGLAVLVEILEADPTLADRVLFVSAGRIDAASADLAQRFVALGGMATDRFVEDDELFSLYRVADYMWAAYAPEYDQSSGVYGRALQTGCPVVVRADSLIERLAGAAGLVTLAVPFDDPAAALAAFAAAAPHPRGVEAAARIDTDGNAARRARFVACIDRGLTPDARKGGADA